MEKTNTKNEHFLYPGALFAHREEYIVTTILGSCVSVCLWDSVNNIGGVNHYLLPLWNGDALPSPRYGNVAIQKLIEKMLALGSKKQDLIAKIFGGAAVLKMSEGFMKIGDRNILLAQDLLKEEKIPIKSSDLGGCVGRKLIYNTATASVLIRKNKPQQAIGTK